MTKKGLHRSLQIYFSKLKKVPTLHLPHHHNTTGAAASRLLSACKYPKTPSFSVDRDHPDGGDAAATLSDVDRFLFENFHSLYARRDNKASGDSNELSSGSPRYDEEPPRIRSTERFFVSPGTSSSLVDEARLSATSSSSSSFGPSKGVPVVPGDGVTVVTLSKDPYDDFLRSMQDMVDARHVDPCRPLDWDFMEELLFCYLELNDKCVHKYILRAFTDLAVSFRRRVPEGRRRVPATRRRRVMEGKVE